MCQFLATRGLILACVIGIISFGLREAGLFDQSAPIVETENGLVEGVIRHSRDGRGYAGYVGIPYAKPPLGELRFQPPVAVGHWKGILKASKYAPDCYQYDAMVKGKFSGDEDCLYLNVHSPKQPNEFSLLPVMVWIHGGGFLSGGAKIYDPKYFMDEDVIVVSMNYRLGPLGFLNTGDEHVRGNMGLKDQNLAMQWVKKNIAYFGGDPDKITIFGESAGAASVHYHLLSPASKGLFYKAIIQSGAVTCPWSLTEDPVSQAKQYGVDVGCPTSSMKDMVKCLRHLSPKQLLTPMINFMIKSPLTEPNDLFVPTIESVIRKDSFLTENPRKLLREGKFASVPLMMGVTSGEGGLRSARFEINDKAMKSIDSEWNHYCPLLHYYDPKRTDVSEKIRSFYFSKTPFLSDIDGFMKNFTLMMSDGLFFHAVHTAALQHSQKAPVYLYFYDYEASVPGMYSLMKAVKSDDWLLVEIKFAVSIAKDFFKRYFGYHGPHEYGACHADDLLQLFSLEWLFEIGQRSKDYQFSKAFVKTFVDFAKDVENLKFKDKLWPKTDSKTSGPLLYMTLDKRGKVVKEPFRDRLPFWDSLKIRK